MKMRIKELRKTLKGWTQAELAQATGLSQSYIGAIESRNINKSPSTDTLVAIANALDSRVGELFDDAKPVPITGKVGAGARVPLVDAYAKGDGLYHVQCPAELPHTTTIIGVEVDGDSMVPAYDNGDVLFYRRDTMGIPTEAINTRCICEDENGDAWVKYIKIGSEPGKFHLISLNPLADNMLNMSLKWAAPVRFHLPKNLVRRFE